MKQGLTTVTHLQPITLNIIIEHRDHTMSSRASSAQTERKMPQIIVMGEQLIPAQTILSDRGLL